MDLRHWLTRTVSGHEPKIVMSVDIWVTGANHSWPDGEDQPGLDSEWSDDEVIELEVLTAGK